MSQQGSTSGPMRDLRDAIAELHEITGRLVEQTVDHRELAEWVTAVAHHAFAVEAAVRELGARVAAR